MSSMTPRGQVRNLVPVLAHPLPAGELTRVHSHALDELVYLVRGTYTALVQGRQHVLAPGDVIYYPQAASHSYSVPLDYSTKLIVLQWQPHSADALPGTVRVAHDGRGRLFSLLTWMLDLTPPTDMAADDLRETLFQAALACVREMFTPREHAIADPIARVQRWIAAHIGYRGGFVLDEMAAVAGMTPVELRTAFRRATGETPTQCLQRLRVEAALPLILHTETPMTEIADRVGLYDTSHLWRLVVRHCGRSPLALRREARKASAVALS